MSLELPREGLSDGAVTLRPWSDDDVEAMTAALSDPDISLWIPVIPYPYSTDDAHRFIDLARREAEEERMVAMAITDSDDGRLLGGSGLSRISLGNRSAEVGYWVAAPERGRGVATRTTALLVDWGFDSLGLERIALLADLDNVASRRVAHKLGFVEEGVLRAHLSTRRGRRDSVSYARLRSDRGTSPDRPALPARINLVTLGVRDAERMRAFFEALGWPRWAAAADGYTAYDTGGAVLALVPLASLAAESRASGERGDWSGVTLAINVADPALVDTSIDAARAAGAEIVKEPVDAQWGGRSGYFSDPEGNRFEVAWAPGSSIDARGALRLPAAPGED